MAATGTEYAGSATCGACHAAVYSEQSASAHARALAPSRPGQPGEWAFGAGAQAITFVSRLASGDYLEHDQSWFARLNRYSRTPGHRNSGGVRYRVFDPDAAILRCFGCHSTGALTIGSDGSIVPAELGVHCESCHGPAAAHARDPAAHRPVDPRHLDGGAINELCGACHRAPSTSPMADLRDPWNARHQPVMLAASRCFRASGAKLTCVNCHSPHRPLETRAGAYDRVCLSCHRTPRHSSETGNAACVSCHMPGVAPTEGLRFANHRIAIYRPGEPLNPVRAAASR
jgi:Cytochrome c554 and c-prime